MTASHTPGPWPSKTAKQKPRIEIGWAPFWSAEPDFSVHITAALLKTCASRAVFRAHIGVSYSVSEEYYVWHSSSGGTDWPWRVSKRWIGGTRGAVDTVRDLDEFKSFREAMTEARRLARAAIAKAEGRS